MIYGPEGIGKSTLASYLPGVYVFDLEKSTRKLDVQRDSDIFDWPTLRGKAATFAQTPPPGVRTLVIDSGTAAQALAVEYVIASKTISVKGAPPSRATSIEDFPYGKGWKYMAEEFDGLIADLDRVRANGINVCIVCHDARANIPNPAGEDFIRWEPNLYAGDKNQHGSVRNRVVGWAEHVLFVSYDIAVNDGKVRGVGSRTICTYPVPTQVAKSRTAQVSEPFDIKDPGAIWRTLGIE